ncbi:MAG: VENN motif pre-toxin domain-containing protein [Chloroflexi bacterium]|nr:VENN motif pre-toxin domain-containing protein [Chloroflexota bacterium]
MKEQRGSDIGCALIVIAALIAGAIFVIAYAPWLLLAAPAAVVVAVLALVILSDITSDDVMVASEEPGGYDGWRISVLNPVRQAFHKAPLLQAPKLRVTYEERQIVKQASKLAAGVAASLQADSSAGEDRKQMQAQASEIPVNMANTLWRLDRLRRMERAIDVRSPEGQQSRDAMIVLEKQIVADLQRGLDALAALPVNVMKVELAQMGRPAERLLASLSETNQHLRDVSASYDELRGTQQK